MWTLTKFSKNKMLLMLTLFNMTKTTLCVNNYRLYKSAAAYKFMYPIHSSFDDVLTSIDHLWMVLWEFGRSLILAFPLDQHYSFIVFKCFYDCIQSFCKIIALFSLLLPPTSLLNPIVMIHYDFYFMVFVVFICYLFHSNTRIAVSFRQSGTAKFLRMAHSIVVLPRWVIGININRWQMKSVFLSFWSVLKHCLILAVNIFKLLGHLICAINSDTLPFPFGIILTLATLFLLVFTLRVGRTRKQQQPNNITISSSSSGSNNNNNNNRRASIFTSTATESNNDSETNQAHHTVSSSSNT